MKQKVFLNQVILSLSPSAIKFMYRPKSGDNHEFIDEEVYSIQHRSSNCFMIKIHHKNDYFKELVKSKN